MHATPSALASRTITLLLLLLALHSISRRSPTENSRSSNTSQKPSAPHAA
jgi:hypothetical protein